VSVALVCAASKGLGRASAEALARDGVRVAICARGGPALREAAAAIEAAGGDVLAIEADLRQAADITRALETTIARFGGLDILVTNTGGPPSGPFMTLDERAWTEAIDSMLLSVVRLCRGAIPHMQARGGGRIINITSISVKQPIEGLVLSNSLRAAVTGRIELSIPGATPVRRFVPVLKGALDWIGLNYYTRWRVRSLSPVPHVAAPGAPRNDLGWEVWPEGFRRAIEACAAITGVPVLVTENGFADEHDAFRSRAIVEFTEAMHAAIAGGANVLGYLHWSLLDNFEWADGFHGRFGLSSVDFADAARPRTRTRSAEVFARIARANALDASAREAAAIRT